MWLARKHSDSISVPGASLLGAKARPEPHSVVAIHGSPGSSAYTFTDTAAHCQQHSCSGCHVFWSATSVHVLCHATGPVLVVGTLLCGPVQPKHQEWPRSLPLPEPTAFLGCIKRFPVIVPRVNDLGQLTLFPCFINLVGFIRRLGAKPKSGQPGSTGDLP